jgi:hypothetical protein
MRPITRDTARVDVEKKYTLRSAMLALNMSGWFREVGAVQCRLEGRVTR